MLTRQKKKRFLKKRKSHNIAQKMDTECATLTFYIKFTGISRLEKHSFARFKREKQKSIGSQTEEFHHPIDSISQAKSI